jgi:hypothetical protein
MRPRASGCFTNSSPSSFNEDRPMKAGARRVPIQEACVSRVNFPSLSHLRAIGCFVEKAELESNVPAWDTLPNSGKASILNVEFVAGGVRHVPATASSSASLIPARGCGIPLHP